MRSQIKIYKRKELNLTMARLKEKIQAEYQNRIEIIIQKLFDGNASKFSKEVGISPSTVSDLRQGNNIAKADKIILISQKTGISADWILGLIPEENMEGSITTSEIHNYTGLSNMAIEKLHQSKKLLQELTEDKKKQDKTKEISKIALFPYIVTKLLESIDKNKALQNIGDYLFEGQFALPFEDGFMLLPDLADFPIQSLDYENDGKAKELFEELFKEYKLRKIGEELSKLSEDVIENININNLPKAKKGYYIPQKVSKPSKAKKK